MLTREQFDKDLELTLAVFGDECRRFWLDHHLSTCKSYSDVCKYVAGAVLRVDTMRVVLPRAQWLYDKSLDTVPSTPPQT